MTSRIFSLHAPIRKREKSSACARGEDSPARGGARTASLQIGRKSVVDYPRKPIHRHGDDDAGVRFPLRHASIGINDSPVARTVHVCACCTHYSRWDSPPVKTRQAVFLLSRERPAFLYSHKFAWQESLPVSPRRSQSDCPPLPPPLPATAVLPSPRRGKYEAKGSRRVKKGEGRRKGNKLGASGKPTIRRWERGRGRKRWWRAFNLIAATGGGRGRELLVSSRRERERKAREVRSGHLCRSPSLVLEMDSECLPERWKFVWQWSRDALRDYSPRRNVPGFAADAFVSRRETCANRFARLRKLNFCARDIASRFGTRMLIIISIIQKCGRLIKCQ